MSVLQPYLAGEARVVAVCHEVPIYALTGYERTPQAGRRSLLSDRW